MPSPQPNGRERGSESLKYDPVVAFLLEFATRLATRDEDAVEAVGKRVFDTMQAILRDSAQWHPITVSRVSFYALKTLKASYVRLSPWMEETLESPELTKARLQDHDFANVPYLLHSISTLSQSVLSKAAELTLAGIATCIDQPGSLRNELMTSPDFWKLLQKLARDPESAAKVFDILERGTSGSPPAIMADNYEAAIALLDDFASAASPLQATDPQGASRRPDQSKKPTK